MPKKPKISVLTVFGENYEDANTKQSQGAYYRSSYAGRNPNDR
jgi:hypothetical protein